MQRIDARTSTKQVSFIVGIVLLITAALVLYYSINQGVDSCPVAEQILTEKAAIEFGRREIGKARRFWAEAGYENETDIKKFLNAKCCYVQNLTNKGDAEWYVGLEGKNSSVPFYVYFIDFDKCGNHVRIYRTLTRRREEDE
jgi:hypothetical protein